MKPESFAQDVCRVGGTPSLITLSIGNGSTKHNILPVAQLALLSHHGEQRLSTKPCQSNVTIIM